MMIDLSKAADVQAQIVRYWFDNGTAVDHRIDTILNIDKSFTRSNGDIISRLYERLTKASRRRADKYYSWPMEAAYRRGVYDAYKALQSELEE